MYPQNQNTESGSKTIISRNYMRDLAVAFAKEAKKKNGWIIFLAVFFFPVTFPIAAISPIGYIIMAAMVILPVYVIISRKNKNKQYLNELLSDVESSRFQIYKTRVNCVTYHSWYCYQYFDRKEDGHQICLKISPIRAEDVFGKVFYLVYIRDKIIRLSETTYEPDAEIRSYVHDITDPEGKVLPYPVSDETMQCLAERTLMLIPGKVTSIYSYADDSARDYFLAFGKAKKFRSKYHISVSEALSIVFKENDPVWFYINQKGKVVSVLSQDGCILSDELKAFICNDPDYIAG